jgi:hypothetical protein
MGKFYELNPSYDPRYHDIHLKFYEGPFRGSKIVKRGYTYTQTGKVIL